VFESLLDDIGAIAQGSFFNYVFAFFKFNYIHEKFELQIVVECRNLKISSVIIIVRNLSIKATFSI
jgi:hypothetical protein